MKTKLFLAVAALFAALPLATAQDASTNAPALTAAQVQQVNAFVDGLLPMIPAADIPLAGKIIGYLGIAAVIGRFLKGWISTGSFTGALWHFVAGIFFNHTPQPPDAAQTSQGAGAAKLRGPALLLVPFLTVLMLAGSVSAQTNNLPLPVADTPPATNSNSFWNDAAAAGKDLLTYVKLMPFTTNTAATLRLGAGENTATHEIIEAATLTVPISQNAGIGIVGAHIGSQWLEGGVSLSYGGNTSLPLLGTVNLFAGDGVVFDFITRAPANYVFTGAEKDWTISDKCRAGIGAVTANTSDRAGVDIIGGGHITWTF